VENKTLISRFDCIDGSAKESVKDVALFVCCTTYTCVGEGDKMGGGDRLERKGGKKLKLLFNKE